MEALKADKARQVGTAVAVTFTPHVLVLAGEALRGMAVSPPSPCLGWTLGSVFRQSFVLTLGKKRLAFLT